MAVLEQKWSWTTLNTGQGKKSAEEKAELHHYLVTFGKYPPGIDRHQRRYYNKLWHLEL